MSIIDHSDPHRDRQLAPRDSAERSCRDQLSPPQFPQSISQPGSARSINHSQRHFAARTALKRYSPQPNYFLTRTNASASQGIQSCSATGINRRSREVSILQDESSSGRRTDAGTAVGRLGAVRGSKNPVESAKKAGMVVVHHRAFFRDCLVRGFELAYGGRDVFAFASIGEWQQSQESRARNPAVIVFFLESGEMSSNADLQFLMSGAMTTPVVIMSDDDNASDVMQALRDGVRGYIPTSLSFNIVVEAVRLVEAGGTFVPISSLVPEPDKADAATRKNDALTERQLRVVEALCQGMANKQIAYSLGMSEHTVKVHLRHIMKKLNARNRTEVAVLTKDFF